MALNIQHMYDLCCIVFYLENFLVNILNVRKCME